MEPIHALLDLASAYHACASVDALLRACASHLASSLQARAVLVWMRSEDGRELTCRGQWTEAGSGIETSQLATEGILLSMIEEAEPVRLAGDEIAAATLTHLSEPARERVKSALYAALPGPSGGAGVIEVLNKRSGVFSADDASLLHDAARLTERPLATLRGIEAEKREQLGTIERLTQLYDLSRVFNSSLEREELLPHIAERISDLLEAGACNVWLVDAEEEEVYFAQQAGEDPTVSDDTRAKLGEGLVGAVAKAGEARLVADAAEEPTLADRKAPDAEFELKTLMLAPLTKDDDVLGVVEVVNKLDGTPFGDDDLFFLTTIAEQAAIALKNANLLESERKAEELDALLNISKEITSTLNLDRILLTVVNQASSVLPFERCSIGIFDRGRFTLAAVSGYEAPPKSAEMDALKRCLEWAAQQEGAVAADKQEDGWKLEPETARTLLPGYLASAGFDGFFALPLKDDQGSLGVIALENKEPAFLTERQVEVLSILASQSTVAVRNAQLYSQVPLINVMQPILARKARLQSIPRERLKRIGLQAAIVAAALLVVPWRIRVGTNAQVVPAQRRAVSADTRGVIQRVHVREGDTVAAGTLLAEQDAGEDRVRLERAQADLALAERQLGEGQQHGDLAAAGQAQLRIEIASAEVALYREKVQRARLTAPLAGIVVTPRIEERVGELLEKGESLCELVEVDRMAVALNVPETSLDLVAPGAAVSIKLNAFPTLTLSGNIDRLSAQSVAFEGEQYFVVRARFTNEGGRARPGMVGRAKLVAAGGWLPRWSPGWYPIGYALLRDPARWAWRWVWSWLP